MFFLFAVAPGPGAYELSKPSTAPARDVAETPFTSTAARFRATTCVHLTAMAIVALAA